MLFRSDRKSTRLNSSHTIISYAVFCLKKKNSAVQQTHSADPPLNNAAPRHPIPVSPGRTRPAPRCEAWPGEYERQAGETGRLRNSGGTKPWRRARLGSDVGSGG